MIVGNPHLFAIHIDVVDEWSNESFLEGIFDVIVGGTRLATPLILSSDSIGVMVYQMKESLEKVLKNEVGIISDTLSGLGGMDLLSALIHITYRKSADVENCWDYVISPDCMTDKAFHLFAYMKEGRINVIGGNVSQSIFGEAVLQMSYIQEMNFQLLNKFNQHDSSVQ